MANYFRIIITFFIISNIFSGCQSVESLKNVKIKGDEFQMELFSLYSAFAEKEAKNYDWVDSQYFASKAMTIAYGHNAEPEHPENWNIPQNIKHKAKEKRNILIEFLKNNNIRTKHPKLLAEAQFYFDCWLEELEEKQAKDISYCLTNFDQKISRLNSITAVNLKKPANVQTETSTLKEQLISNTREFFSYRIFFEFGSANLTKGSKQSLKRIASKIKKIHPAPEEISLNGYTDKSGDSSYNIHLSKKRAESVRNYLSSLGIKKDKIVIYALGDSDFLFEDMEGLKEPASRRVEINIVD